MCLNEKPQAIRRLGAVSADTSLARLFLGELLLSSAASASPDGHIVSSVADRSKPLETLKVRSLRLNFQRKSKKIRKKTRFAGSPLLHNQRYPKRRGKQEALRELTVSEQATRRTGQITVSVEQRAVDRIRPLPHVRFHRMASVAASRRYRQCLICPIWKVKTAETTMFRLCFLYVSRNDSPISRLMKHR